MNSPRTLESNIDAVVLKLVVMKKSRVETEVQFSVRFRVAVVEMKKTHKTKTGKESRLNLGCGFSLLPLSSGHKKDEARTLFNSTN